jgi:addiction module HigA family antidote
MKNPPHVGEFIYNEVIKALGLTVTDAAKALGVTRQALNNLLNEKAALTEEMAIRIERVFGPRAEHLMRMQLAYNMAQARRHMAHQVRSLRPATEVRLLADSGTEPDRIKKSGASERLHHFEFDGETFTAREDAERGVRLDGHFKTWTALIVGGVRHALEPGSAKTERLCPSLKLIDLVKALRQGRSNEGMLPRFAQ